MPGYKQTGSNISRFVDSLANTIGGISNPQNASCVNNLNWIYSVFGFDPPYAAPFETSSNWNMGSTLSAGGGVGLAITTLQTAANPAYSIPSGIIPVKLGAQNPVYYNAKQKYVQVQFNASAVGATGPGIFNFEDQSGVGAAGSSQIDHDGYLLRMDGFLIRYNSGAANVALQSGIVFTQGDIWRMSVDSTVAGQVTIRLTKNGVLFSTVVDNNVNRLNGRGFPCIINVVAAAGTVYEVKNFDAGIGL